MGSDGAWKWKDFRRSRTYEAKLSKEGQWDSIGSQQLKSEICAKLVEIWKLMVIVYEISIPKFPIEKVFVTFSKPKNELTNSDDT